jgi:hypothetical protein
MKGIEAASRFLEDMARYDAARKLPGVEAENQRLRQENQLLRQQNERLHQSLELALKERGIGQQVSQTA